MFTLILAAAIGQCGSRASYGYAKSYAAPTYYAQPAYAAQQYYQQPAQQQYYQAPAYNYSLVGDMLRQETAYAAAAKTEAKLDVLLKLLTERATPPPPPVQPAPQPQFSAPYPSPQAPAKAPPVQYEAPFPTAQQPSKAPPVEQYQAQPSQQYPSQPQWALPSDQAPFATKPSPTPATPPSPSFESSGWVPPPTSGGGAAAQAVAMMTAGIQARCTPCHVGSNEKGGGVKLLEIDGQLADITPYLGSGEGGIEKAITSGRMPKNGPRLNNQELYAFLMGLRAYEAQSRARQNVVASFGQ